MGVSSTNNTNTRTTHHSKWILGENTRLREAFPVHPAVFFAFKFILYIFRPRNLKVTLTIAFTTLLAITTHEPLTAILTTLLLVTLYSSIYFTVYTMKNPHLSFIRTQTTNYSTTNYTTKARYRITSPVLVSIYYSNRIKRRWPKAAVAASLHRVTYSTTSRIPRISTPKPLNANQEGTAFKFKVYLSRAQKAARDVDYKLEYIVSSLKAYSATTEHIQPGICTILVYFKQPTSTNTQHTAQQLVHQTISSYTTPIPQTSTTSTHPAQAPQTPQKHLTPAHADTGTPALVSLAKRKLPSQGITFLYQLYDTEYGSAHPPAYIGITSNLKRRLKQHEDEWPSHQWNSIRHSRTTSIKFITRKEAEREESRLIRTLNPKYNTKGR